MEVNSSLTYVRHIISVKLWHFLGCASGGYGTLFLNLLRLSTEARPGVCLVLLLKAGVLDSPLGI